MVKYIRKLWEESEWDCGEMSFKYVGEFDREMGCRGFGVSGVKGGNEVRGEWEGG